MPLVQAFVASRVNMTCRNGAVRDIGLACLEVVPSAFNSEEGALTPGSIEFIPFAVPSVGHMTADVVLVIEAYDFADRKANLDERCEQIKQALEELFPDYSFAVWGKLVCAGWATNSTDADFDGDMSMEAAIQRASRAIKSAAT